MKKYLKLAGAFALAIGMSALMGAGVTGLFTQVSSVNGYQVNGTAGRSGQALCSNGTYYATACSLPSQYEGIVISSGLCSTTTGGYNSCGNTFTWPAAFADTNYSVNCTYGTPVGSGNLTGIWVTNKTTTGGEVWIQNGDGSAAQIMTASEIDCVGIHP